MMARINPFKPTAGMNPPELIGRDFETSADRPRDFRPPSKKTEVAGSHLGAFEEILDACLRDFGLD